MSNPVTKSGIEYVHNDDGFFPVNPEHNNREGIAECVYHHHSESYGKTHIHWAVRAGVFGIGFALAPGGRSPLAACLRLVRVQQEACDGTWLLSGHLHGYGAVRTQEHG